MSIVMKAVLLSQQSLPTMVLCLMLQTGLLVVVMRYYLKRQNKVNIASLWSSLLVINGVLMIGVSTAALMSTFQSATKKFIAAMGRPLIK